MIYGFDNNLGLILWVIKEFFGYFKWDVNKFLFVLKVYYVLFDRICMFEVL